VEYRYVACKLHGLNAQWSEEKKQSYIRHAIREMEKIHRIVVFETEIKVEGYGGGSRCLDSSRSSPAGARDDLSGPLPFGQNDNNRWIAEKVILVVR
jgi:hypothetical protein